MRYVYVVTYRATIRATQNAAKAAEIALHHAGEAHDVRRRDQMARKLRQGQRVTFPLLTELGQYVRAVRVEFE